MIFNEIVWVVGVCDVEMDDVEVWRIIYLI